MDITYYGANCVEIGTKRGSVVIDPGLSHVGLKDKLVKEAIYIATQANFLPPKHDGVTVEGPGEYEIRDFSIKGVPARRMIDHEDVRGTTVYRVVIDEVAIAVVGHVAAPLPDELLEEIGVIDLAIIPVGGGGYTLDSHQATTVVRQLDPKVVIPTHYADSALSYEVPQLELAPFIKEISAEHEVTAKFKIKNGVLPDVLTVVELTRS